LSITISPSLDRTEQIAYEFFLRYFGAFPDEVIKFFYANVDEWELRMILRALSLTGISVDTLNRVHPQTLAQVPFALVYHILSNTSILLDPWILKLIHSLPLGDFLGWPTDIPPPGLLLLILDEEPKVRQWARNQISNFTLVPIPKDRFTQPFIAVLETMVAALERHRSIVSSQYYPPASNLDVSAVHSFSFTSDPSEFWSGVGAILRLIPPEFMVSTSTTRVDFRRVIIGHLHDTGPRQSFTVSFVRDVRLSCFSASVMARVAVD
jgi:senataxin